MKNTLILFICSVVSLVFISCGPDPFFITFKKDKTVRVSSLFNYDPPPTIRMFKEKKTFYQNNNITNFIQTDTGSVYYDVTSIDSLGNCICPYINRDLFSFTLSNDTLIIRSKKGKVISDHINAPKKYNFNLNLNFPEKPTVTTKYKNVFIKNNTIIISFESKKLKKEDFEVKILTGIK